MYNGNQRLVTRCQYIANKVNSYSWMKFLAVGV